ncbi:Transcription factor YY2 [Holothuria leucospilota]|uniref:Transcription factor YY2 n=1 Tax=Holothuria leucospilota TaxID=206669 RepID=A0A9Q1CTV6_HOLLE|nr:Transcription factor YY2 [Holothuria leucospilota]
MDYLSNEEEKVMIAALEKVERLERAKKTASSVSRKMAKFMVYFAHRAARQQTERSEEAGVACEPSESNHSSPDQGVTRKRRKPEIMESDVSSEDEEEQKAARKSQPNQGKGVSCEFGCGKAFTDRNKMKQHLRRVHVPRQHACERCTKTFKSQSNLKRHMRSTGLCAAKRQRKDDMAGEEPNTSAATTPDESSSDYADLLTEAAKADRSIVEDGVEIGGGEDNREDDVLDEDPLIMTEEMLREMRDMMCDLYKNNWGLFVLIIADITGYKMSIILG